MSEPARRLLAPIAARSSERDRLEGESDGGIARVASPTVGSQTGDPRECGFTLIEIMVALAVFSLAILALLRLETATIRGAAVLDDSLLAGLVARNIANDAVSDARPPVAGRTTGSEVNGGRAWNWVRQVRATGNSSIVRIDVAVSNRAGQIVGHTSAIRPPDEPS